MQGKKATNNYKRSDKEEEGRYKNMSRKKTDTNKVKRLKIMQWNADFLGTKRKELEVFMRDRERHRHSMYAGNKNDRER